MRCVLSVFLCTVKRFLCSQFCQSIIVLYRLSIVVVLNIWQLWLPGVYPGLVVSIRCWMKKSISGSLVISYRRQPYVETSQPFKSICGADCSGLVSDICAWIWFSCKWSDGIPKPTARYMKTEIGNRSYFIKKPTKISNRSRLKNTATDPALSIKTCLIFYVVP